MKRCRTCREAKPESEFWGDPKRADGLQSECKACMRERSGAYHKHRKNDPAYQESNREAVTRSRRRNPKLMLLRSIRWRAKQAGIKCSLTSEDIVVPEFCPVLGIRLSFGIGFGEGTSLEVRDRRASVDRVDNSRGYEPDNIVIVSYRANRIKSDATPAELRKIAEFYNAVRS